VTSLLKREIRLNVIFVICYDVVLAHVLELEADALGCGTVRREIRT